MNLSYTSLTSFAVRECLRELKHTDPKFWAELQGACEQIISDTDLMQEDSIPDPEEEDGIDSSEVPIGAVVATVVEGACPDGISTDENGGLKFDGDAENREPEEGVDDLQVTAGCTRQGKRRIVPNRWYSNKEYTWHGDADKLDVGEE